MTIKYDLATTYTRLGDARYRQRNFHDSIMELERAAAVLTELANTDANDNVSLRNLVDALGSMAKAQEGLAAQASGVEKRVYRRVARTSYERAVDILRRLEANDALSKYDQKSLEKLRATLEKYEQ